MADSEASGDSRVDGPVDTDRLGVQAPDGAESDQEFDYLLEPQDEGDPPTELEYAPVTHGADWGPVTAADGPRDDRFDAFDANTWHFKPAPTPWFATRPAILAIGAVSVAVVALVVSVVLLAFHPAEDVPTHDTSTAPSSAPTSATATSSALPPPPPPLPPPPPPPPQQSAPAYYPRSQPRPTKKPEINVTRAPMSVSPQPRGTR